VTASRVLLILLLLIVVLFSPLRTLQFVALIYIALIVLSWLYSLLARRYVTVRRKELLLRTYRFEPAQITLIVENRSPLPVTYLNILDAANYFFVSEPGNFLIELRPGERKMLSYRIESQQRGEYFLGPAVMQGSDPLGLFPFKKQALERQTLIVYPEILPVSLPTPAGIPAGTIRVENRIYEDVTRYRSLRDYLPGDELRRINWKVSAKSGRLQVVEYLPLLSTPVLILLNLNSEEYPMRLRYHRIERAAALAASLVAHFLALHQEVGLIAAAKLDQAGRAPAAEIRGTHEHAMLLLEMLARMEASSGELDVTRLPFEAGLEIPVRTRVEVITPNLSDEQWQRLRRLREMGCSVELFMLGSEHLKNGQTRAKEFRIFTVQDFGNELFR